MQRYVRLSFIPLVIFVLLSLAACGGAGQSSPVAGLIDQFGQTLGQEMSTLAPDPLPDFSAGTTLSPSAALAADGQLAAIYSDVSPSVVHIQVARPASDLPDGHIEVPGLPNDAPQLFGEGSGFVWDEAGHIVTNNHVVDGAQKITVLFADDTAVDAELVGADPDSDLAILHVDAPEALLYPVRLGDSTTLQVGQRAIAI
ncbi:MAG: trypsin-like peptidase domain-containing protein, partial [Chloroflexota bacterium]